MVSMFHSVLQFQFVLATSARKMLIYTSRRALSIDSCDDGVHAKQNLGGIKNLQDYYHDRKKKVSFGSLTHDSSIGQKMPKAMDLLKWCFHSLVGIPVQHGERTSRETCAYLAPDLRSKHTLLRKHKIAKTNHLPVCELHSP